MKKGGVDKEGAGLSIHLRGWEMPWLESTKADSVTLYMPNVTDRRSFSDSFFFLFGLRGQCKTVS